MLFCAVCPCEQLVLCQKQQGAAICQARASERGAVAMQNDPNTDRSGLKKQKKTFLNVYEAAWLAQQLNIARVNINKTNG